MDAACLELPIFIFSPARPKQLRGQSWWDESSPSLEAVTGISGLDHPLCFLATTDVQQLLSLSLGLHQPAQWWSLIVFEPKDFLCPWKDISGTYQNFFSFFVEIQTLKNSSTGHPGMDPPEVMNCFSKL